MNKEVVYEGYCKVPFDRGQKVRIRKGAMVISTHPQKPDPYPLARSQVVTVHHIMPGQTYDNLTITERDIDWLELKGYGEQLEELFRLREERDIDGLEEFRIHTLNPRVVWTGSGGYWFEADVNDVDPE